MEKTRIISTLTSHGSVIGQPALSMFGHGSVIGQPILSIFWFGSYTPPLFVSRQVVCSDARIN